MGFLFNLRKPRQYNVKYRIYDEQKERLRESEARVREKLGMEKSDDTKRSSGRLEYGVFRDSIDNSRAEKSRNMRFGIIVGVFLMLAYLLIHYAG